MYRLLDAFTRYCLWNYKSIIVRLLLVYVILYPIIVFYSIFGIFGQKRLLYGKELSYGPLVKNKGEPNNLIGKDVPSFQYAMGRMGFIDLPITFEEYKRESEKVENFLLNNEEVENIMNNAEDMMNDMIFDLNDKPFIYVTIVNQSFREIMMNWLCNVQIFDTILDRTLIIATTKYICDRIQEEYSEVTCLVISVPLSFNKDFEDQPIHRRIFTSFRINIMKRLAQKSIPFVFFESDSIWFRDPSDLFTNMTLIDNIDIAVGASSDITHRKPYSSDPLMIFPTNKSILFLEESIRLIDQGVEQYHHDVINNLCLSQFNNMVCQLFYWNDIADGRWFEYGDRERSVYKPYIVNNNLKQEVEDKMARLIMNKMWMMNRTKCDTKIRKELIMKYGDKDIFKTKRNMTKPNMLHKNIFTRAWADFKWNFGRFIRKFKIF